MQKQHCYQVYLTLLCFVFLAGCATKIAPPSEAPQPAKVKFAQYKKVILRNVVLNPAYQKHGANQKAVKKINELLIADVRQIFPDLIIIGENDKVDPVTEKTLLIEPYVEEIKFIGGAARFFAGALAGSSAVRMKVTFTDLTTGEVIAQPEFYSKSNAFAGAWTVGGTDNMMLKAVVQDICNYIVYNR